MAMAMASHFSLPWVLNHNTSMNFPSLVPFSQSKNPSSKPQKTRYHDIPKSKSSNAEQNHHNSNSKDDDREESLNKFDRRDVLFGLGGAAGVMLGGAGNSFASSHHYEPGISPNFRKCGESTITKTLELEPIEGEINCCPPIFHGMKIIPFERPCFHRKPRVRPAIHLMTDEQHMKYQKAIEKMKNLEPCDPRNFYQQANVHCTYCNDAYEQEGYPGIKLQVHENWLFFPFHRCYLYFYERILGHLIDDPTFALPFWNWDNPDGGMQMPEIYNNPKSPFFNPLRDKRHLPPTLINLEFSDERGTRKPYDTVASNLSVMYRQMITNSKNKDSFFGKRIRGGEKAINRSGSFELTPHNNVHLWVGDPESKLYQEMGNFFSAARDPLFYGHHGNVDRMWNLRKYEFGHTDITNRSWLDSSFVFFDEYKNAVRIKIRDCLDTKKLGYVYQDVPIKWRYAKPKPFLQKKEKPILPKVSFPVVLNSNLSIVLRRPKKSRTKKEKEEEDETIVIEGIQFDQRLPIVFHVLVNVLDDENVNPGNTQFAGSFSSVPRVHKHNKEGKNPKSSLCCFVITELLEDLGSDDDDTVLVTLIPKLGGGKISIDGINIKLLPLNDDEGKDEDVDENENEN